MACHDPLQPLTITLGDLFDEADFGVGGTGNPDEVVLAKGPEGKETMTAVTSLMYN